MKSAIEIIETIYTAGATSKKAMLDTLTDGAAYLALGFTDVDQGSVEDAYSMLSESDIDEHLASGGTIGNYQW